MNRNKGFRALSALLSLAMLTAGFASSMTQAAQAATSLQAPVVAAASATTSVNTPVSLKPTTTSVGTDLRFCLVAPALSTAAASEANCSNGPVKVAGEGSWNIAAKTGEVLFSPEANFAGTTTPVSYVATDSNGSGKAPLKVDVEKPLGPPVSGNSVTTSANTPVVIKPSVSSSQNLAPVVAPVDAKSAFGKTFSFKPRVTGAGIDWAHACLIDPADKLCKDKVVVSGEGTWKVDNTGWASFTPEGNFSGAATPVTYQVANNSGQVGSAQVQITVMAPASPTVQTMFEITDYNTAIKLNPVVTGEALDPNHVCLVDPADGQCKTTVETSEGTWVANTNDGSVTFTPAPTYAGTTKPIDYRAYNTLGGFGHAGLVIHVNRPVASAPIVVGGSVISTYSVGAVRDADASTGAGNVGVTQNLNAVNRRVTDSWTLDATPKDGSRFIQWSCSPGYTNYVAGTPILTASFTILQSELTQNVTCSAIFAYVVTFTAGNNGSVTHSGDNIPTAAQYNDLTYSLTSVATPATGYKFTDWTCDTADSSIVITGNSVTVGPINVSVTCTANFEKQPYTVSFIAGNHGSVDYSGETYYYGDTTTSSTASADSGYDFKDWTCSPSSPANVDVTNATISVSPVTTDVTCTANFVQTFTVTYNVTTGGSVDSTGGSVTPTSDLVQYDGSSSSTATASQGYVFNGWTCSPNTYTTSLSTAATVTLASIRADVTCTADFKVTKYTVTYNANAGGSVTPTTDSVDFDASSSSTATASSGYVFNGWTCSPNSYTTSTSADLTVTLALIEADVTCTADFKAQTFNVTYNANAGGSVTPTSDSVNFDGSSSSTATANDGYTFNGWTCSPNTYTTSLSSDATVTLALIEADVTCTADFKVKTFTVTFNANAGGSVTPTTDTVDYDGSSSSVASANTGYEFNGWSCSPNTYTTSLSTDLTVQLASIRGNVTCTADFKIKKFDVTFNANPGGSVTYSGTHSYDYGTTASSDATPGPHSFFNGWTCSPVGNPAYAPDFTLYPNIVNVAFAVTESVTCTADFIVQTWTVTFDSSGNGNVTNPGPNTVNDGDAISSVATPANGYYFDSWTCVPADFNANTATITLSNVTQNIACTANFLQLPTPPYVHHYEAEVDYATASEIVPVVDGTEIQPSLACIFDKDGNCVKEVFVENKGTFKVLDNGNVTFTPLETFANDTASITYQATDRWGQTGTGVLSIFVRLPQAPTVSPDAATVDYNQVATLAPAVVGTLIQPQNACLIDLDGNCVRQLLVVVVVVVHYVVVLRHLVDY